MLSFQQRPARGEPEGMIVLHHGRGTNEYDLLPLAGVLDPEQRLLVITPRAPLPFLDGYRWYETPQVGHPDPATFHSSYRQLAELHDELWRQTGLAPERTILGGFSMGTVMSYALGLGGDRPAPAGILAFSGFVPTVSGWQPDLGTRPGLPVLIAHGSADPVIGVEFGRAAHELLERGGLAVDYRESRAGHQIDPADIPRAAAWIAAALPPPGE